MRLEANESIYRHCEITQQWFCCWIAIYCLFVFFFICSRFPRKIELTGRGNEVETLPKITDKWWIICSFAILLKRSGISLEKKKVNVPWVLKWIDWAAGARRPLPGGRDATAVTRGPWRGGRDAGALTRGPGRGVRGAKSRDAWAGARGPGRGGPDAGAGTRGSGRRGRMKWSATFSSAFSRSVGGNWQRWRGRRRRRQRPALMSTNNDVNNVTMCGRMHASLPAHMLEITGYTKPELGLSGVSSFKQLD